MTVVADIVNMALQTIGTRTTVTATELLNSSTNEAIQANLTLYRTRDDLLRMAPWACAMNYNLLAYITSTPGTPENPSQQTVTWTKGLPPPPWAYEYQYPADCLKALWIVPQFNQGIGSGIPITTAVTGGSPNIWDGPPVKFRPGIDQFFSVVSATVANGGTGYAVGDLIVLTPGAYGPNNVPTNTPPIGCPAILKVLTAPGGIIGTVAIVNSFQQAQPENDEPVSGSYFLSQVSPVPQGTTSGSGVGATFNLTFSAQMDQRVIWTNQQFATLAYIKQVSDPNIMDPMFITSWAHILGARLAMALTGDKAIANQQIGLANLAVTEARKADGNEGLTINDVTPDWIRIRGMSSYSAWAPYNAGFDWGPLFTPY
jgi:hypothetical protein